MLAFHEQYDNWNPSCFENWGIHTKWSILGTDRDVYILYVSAGTVGTVQHTVFQKLICRCVGCVAKETCDGITVSVWVG